MSSTYRYSGTADEILPLERVIPPKASIIAARGLPRLDDIRALIVGGTVLPPITVYQHGGRIYLIDGLHRYTVSTQMSYTHIPVLFCSDDDFPIRPFTVADYE